MNNLLRRLGIIRHVMKQDLLYFFVPWMAAMILEIGLCSQDGDVFAMFWQDLWQSITQPTHLLVQPVHRTIGTVLFVTGLSTMIVAQVTLWRNYSGFVVIKEDHQLITHGIYQYTRNPIYFGALIVFCGLPIYASSVLGFLAMFLQVPIFLFRIHMEEMLLSEHFGDEYRAYCESTKRLIPFVY